VVVAEAPAEAVPTSEPSTPDVAGTIASAVSSVVTTLLNPPRPISSGFSKPAVTNSAGIPACTSLCVGSGSLLAIGCLDINGATVA
jgi:hypothetical protein